MSHMPYMTGFSCELPKTIITNAQLEKYVETTSEWIESRTGIMQRHRIDEGMPATELGVAAAKKCLDTTGWSADDLTHIIAASCSSDFNCPPTACVIGKNLQTRGQLCVDINTACTGFLTGIELACSLLKAHPDSRILLTATETLSRYCNWSDRSTCILFGDGAGAVLLANEHILPTKPQLRARINDSLLTSDGAHCDLLHFGGKLSTPTQNSPETPMGDEQFIHMEGREVFKYAVRYMTDICQKVLVRNNLRIQDIDLLVPHQANSRIIEAVGSRLQIDKAKVFMNVQRYGNTSAASIPIALAEIITEGHVGKGSKVLLASFGGGFTWGATLVEFV